jgi:hypothetical protein
MAEFSLFVGRVAFRGLTAEDLVVLLWPTMGWDAKKKKKKKKIGV